MADRHQYGQRDRNGVPSFQGLPEAYRWWSAVLNPQEVRMAFLPGCCRSSQQMKSTRSECLTTLFPTGLPVALCSLFWFERWHFVPVDARRISETGNMQLPPMKDSAFHGDTLFLFEFSRWHISRWHFVPFWNFRCPGQGFAYFSELIDLFPFLLRSSFTQGICIPNGNTDMAEQRYASSAVWTSGGQAVAAAGLVAS